MSGLIRSGLLLIMICLASGVTAQPRPMEEGAHYQRINPPVVTRAEADIIEILDVFWYGCPQCREFEPMMTYYGNQIRGDLIMRRMPAIWNEVMLTHARVYFTGVELGIDKQAHPEAFRYVQEEHLTLNTAEDAQAFFKTLGVMPAEFEAVWSSAKVEADIALALADTATAAIDRVPALLVNGRYKVERNASVSELTEVIITANQLIRILRDERRPN